MGYGSSLSMLSMFLFADREQGIPQWKRTWDAKSFWAECVILPKPGFAEKRGIGGQ